MSSRTSSMNGGVMVNRTVGGGAGDMPCTRKSSGRAEFAERGNASFSSSMEVLEPGDTDEKPDQNSHRISLGSREQSQRVTMPTKHISLTAVRRKQATEIPIEPELDWREFTRSNSRLGLGGRSNSNTFQSVEDRAMADCGEAQMTKSQACAIPSDSAATGVTTQMKAMAVEEKRQTQEQKKKESSDDDGEDEGDNDSDADREPRKAPNELLMEFLDCIMKKDFVNAEKLCRMILIYEPNNPEALTFHPVIMEKLQLDQEAADAGESGEEDDDDNSDDDDEDDDEDDDDDGDDSEEDSSLENDSSDDEQEDDEENNLLQDEEEPPRPDSGIGM